MKESLDYPWGSMYNPLNSIHNLGEMITAQVFVFTVSGVGNAQGTVSMQSCNVHLWDVLQR